MAFLRHRYWLLFLLISIRVIFLPQSSESLLLQPISHCCTLFETERTWKSRHDYFHTYNLKLSLSKTVRVAFYLNNQESKRELKIYNSNNLLSFCPVPTYFGVKLNRSLTFRHHFVVLRKKMVSSRVALLRQLAKMGCRTKIL